MHHHPCYQLDLIPIKYKPAIHRWPLSSIPQTIYAHYHHKYNDVPSPTMKYHTILYSFDNYSIDTVTPSQSLSVRTHCSHQKLIRYLHLQYSHNTRRDPYSQPHLFTIPYIPPSKQYVSYMPNTTPASNSNIQLDNHTKYCFYSNSNITQKTLYIYHYIILKSTPSILIYNYVHITHSYTQAYIYIYTERGREREIDRQI